MNIQEIKDGKIKSLQGADLRDADLQGADLQCADLQHANLRGADLRVANLQGANLQYADFQGANLQGANLQYSYLRDTNLRDTNLRGANLRVADLRGANLQGANLQGANLRGANLQGANLPNYSVVPEEGSFIAWKKVQNTIVKLLIPSDAKRLSSLVSRKCRASYVIVLKVIDQSDDWTGVTTGCGKGPATKYSMGEIVKADPFDDDIRIECSHGIHFFLTRKEAEEWSN
jgi:hypothetical protein